MAIIMSWGSATTVINEAAAIASTEFSTNTTQLDNSSNLYPYALAVFDCPDTFAAAPNNQSTIDLYQVLDDVDGTTDESAVPSGSDHESATWVGSFLLYDSDERQTKAITISLHGVKKARYFIKNNSGQALSYSSNPITVKITPFTYADSA